MFIYARDLALQDSPILLKRGKIIVFLRVCKDRFIDITV